jgi:hypothetical protein
MDIYPIEHKTGYSRDTKDACFPLWGKMDRKDIHFLFVNKIENYVPTKHSFYSPIMFLP